MFERFPGGGGGGGGEQEKRRRAFRLGGMSGPRHGEEEGRGTERILSCGTT